MFRFKNEKSGILLCTDVLARGVDIPAVILIFRNNRIVPGGAFSDFRYLDRGVIFHLFKHRIFRIFSLKTLFLRYNISNFK